MTVTCSVAGALGLDALCYPFMQRALLAGLCVGLVGPLVGTFLVHRRMAIIGDTLAHTAFAGVALGLFLDAAFDWAVPPTLSALAAAVVAALLVQLLAERTDAYGDTSMVIVLAGGFALGTVLVSATDGGIAVGISQYLFGSLATVTREGVSLLLAVTPVVVGIVAVTYKQLLTVTLDEETARVTRVNVRRYERLLVVLTAIVVVVSMQILGVILVSAMLVIPVAAAAQLARSFRESMLLAVLIGELAVLVGIALAYGYGLAAGGSIVLVAIGGFVVAAGLRRSVP